MFSKIHMYCFALWVLLTHNATTLFAQQSYLNKLSDTDTLHEITYAYYKVNNSVFGIGYTFIDTGAPHSWNKIHIARYDDNFDKVDEIFLGDTNYFYYVAYGCYLDGYFYVPIIRLDISQFPNTDRESFIYKIDTLGNLIWEKHILNTSPSVTLFKNTFSETSELISCGTFKVNQNDWGVFLISTDTSGIINWQKFYGVGNNRDEKYLYISNTSDKGFVLTVLEQISGWNYRTRVYKLDSLGNTQWTKLLGGTGESWGLSCIELPNGNYFCGGGRPHPQYGNYTSYQWINILSPTGNVLRDTSYYFCDIFPICQNGFSFWATPQIDNNSIKVIGFSYAGIATIYYTKMDFMGNIIWKRPYNRRQADAVIGTQIPLGNGFTFLGGFAFADDTTNTADNWYIIVDDDGCDTLNCTLSIPPLERGAGGVLIYPNPTSGIINLELIDEEFKNSQNIICKIYDVSGKVIFVPPLLGRGARGEVNLNHLPNGIYFLQLSNGDDINISKKIIIQK